MKPLHLALAGVAGLVLYKWLASPKTETAAAPAPSPALPNVKVFSNKASFMYPGRAAAYFNPPAAPAPAPAVAAEGPGQISGTLVAKPGTSYQATVVVHAPASWLANAEKVKRYAEGEGFSNVSVSTKPPPGWLGARGDYHVSATYSAEPKVFERSHGGGQVQITDVWRV